MQGYNSVADGGYTDDLKRVGSGLGANWTVAANNFNTDANGATPTTNGQFNGCFYSAGTFAANQYAQVKIPTLPDGQYDNAGVALRADANGNFYYIVFDAYANEVYVGVFYNNGGSSSEWYTISTAGLIAGDTLKATISGYVITVYKNGGQIGQTTDANSRLATGKAGLAAYATSAVRLSDWAAGDL
jgi:hypothetical protein